MDVQPDNHREKWKLSIVIPTLNEEATIAAVLDDVAPYADEILVVDGNSSDKTRDIAQGRCARVVTDNGRGKGAAIRLGLTLATHPIVIFIDGDGSHEAADIPALISPIRNNTADIVIGSRMTGGSDELFSDAGEFIRLTGSMIINLAINYRWNVRLSDTQNGYRAVIRELALHLGMKSDSTTIEQEMVMKALALNYRVMNIPSHEYKRAGGESKIIVSRVWPSYVFNVIRHVVKPDRNNTRSDF